MEPITTQELMSVFNSYTSLKRLGFTFKKACETPAILTMLTCAAKHRRKQAQKQGKHLPTQPALF